MSRLWSIEEAIEPVGKLDEATEVSVSLTPIECNCFIFYILYAASATTDSLSSLYSRVFTVCSICSWL